MQNWNECISLCRNFSEILFFVCWFRFWGEWERVQICNFGCLVCHYVEQTGLLIMRFTCPCLLSGRIKGMRQYISKRVNIFFVASNCSFSFSEAYLILFFSPCLYMSVNCHFSWKGKSFSKGKKMIHLNLLFSFFLGKKILSVME